MLSQLAQASRGSEGEKQLATGKLLQFDHVRGYGFVAAEDGGEDIFLHASVFDEDSELLRPGMRVEFEIMNSDRGRKAFAAHLIQDRVNGDGQALVPGPAVLMAVHGAPMPVQAAGETATPLEQDMTALLAQPAPPVQPTPPAQGAPVAPTQSESSGVVDEEQLCDVLSPDELTHALTELLLRAVPELTGRQILDTRQSLLDFAKQHGWSDG
jgi:cold shock CspA family protein